MDRHDLDGATAADLAAAHMKDLRSQERHGVRFLSYWFDYDRNAAFCLVEAPDTDTAQQVHREAHGGVANEIIAVDREAVARFLGRIDDPLMTGREPESALRFILFTDIEGSTALVQRLGDDRAMQVFRAHDRVVRGELARTGGREVKHTGDGIMASFASVRSALDAAIGMQRGFRSHGQGSPEPMRVRIGISVGEPVAEGDDLFGSAVQLAARLCAHAEPGAIAVSGVLSELAIGKGFLFTPRVQAELKGFEDPVTVCQVLWET
jgi:class 3 adenylate cyclase